MWILLDSSLTILLVSEFHFDNPCWNLGPSFMFTLLSSLLRPRLNLSDSCYIYEESTSEKYVHIYNSLIQIIFINLHCLALEELTLIPILGHPILVLATGKPWNFRIYRAGSLTQTLPGDSPEIPCKSVGDSADFILVVREETTWRPNYWESQFHGTSTK